VTARNVCELLNKKNILQNPKTNIIYNQNYNNFLIRFQIIKGLQGKDLREIVDEAKVENNDMLIFIFGENENKLSLAVGVSGACLNKYDASDFAKKISKLINGKGGGGRKDFAQAGGEIQTSLNSVFQFILNEIKLV
jgi:alanyl-tRNA synthetase